MGRAVRPTSADALRRLPDNELDAYIAGTKLRLGAMTKASLRNAYRKQLLMAEAIKAERSSDLSSG